MLHLVIEVFKSGMENVLLAFSCRCIKAYVTDIQMHRNAYVHQDVSEEKWCYFVHWEECGLVQLKLNKPMIVTAPVLFIHSFLALQCIVQVLVVRVKNTILSYLCTISIQPVFTIVILHDLWFSTGAPLVFHMHMSSWYGTAISTCQLHRSFCTNLKTVNHTTS